jgi:hypothetical protein
MKCAFCGTEYPLDAVMCRECKDYKGLENLDGLTPLSLALDEVFALMADAREHHLENHPSDCDCDYREGEE